MESENKENKENKENNPLKPGFYYDPRSFWAFYFSGDFDNEGKAIIQDSYGTLRYSPNCFQYLKHIENPKDFIDKSKLNIDLLEKIIQEQEVEQAVKNIIRGDGGKI